MATYRYEAYEKDGAIVRGELDAGGKEEVLTYLHRRNLTPVLVEDAKEGQGLSKNITLFEHIDSVDILFLVRNLATAIKAGATIMDALQILSADTSKGIMKRMLQDVQSSISSGLPISKAFEAYRSVFPVAFIGMLRAGEATGDLGGTLSTLSDFLRKDFSLRARVKSALVYPAILVVASTGVIALMLIVVLPRLSGIFSSQNLQLPLITRFFFGLSKALTFSFTLDVVVVVGFIAGIFVMRRTEKGKRLLVKILSHTPIASDVMRKVAIVRFARTFGTLVSGGVVAIESLEITRESIGNVAYEDALTKAIEDMKNGSPLSRTLSGYPDLFPNILLSLIRVGEQTGTMGQILSSLAEFYDEEVDNRLKDLTTILEPLLLLVMGGVVGGVAIAILLPIYQLVGKFS